MGLSLRHEPVERVARRVVGEDLDDLELHRLGPAFVPGALKRLVAVAPHPEVEPDPVLDGVERRRGVDPVLARGRGMDAEDAPRPDLLLVLPLEEGLLLRGHEGWTVRALARGHASGVGVLAWTRGGGESNRGRQINRSGLATLGARGGGDMPDGAWRGMTASSATPQSERRWGTGERWHRDALKQRCGRNRAGGAVRDS